MGRFRKARFEIQNRTDKKGTQKEKEFVVTDLLLTHRDQKEQRRISHLQYCKWEMKAIPTRGILELMESAWELNEAMETLQNAARNARPILIHCTDETNWCGN